MSAILITWRTRKKNVKICENLLDALLMAETPEGMPTKDFLSILKSYFESGKEFSVLLKGAVNSQMRALLRE